MNALLQISLWAWPHCFTAVGNMLEMSISRPLGMRLKNESVHFCHRVFACNQPDWSRRQSSRPAMFFPACLCSREKKKEAEISRDALAGTFAIPLSRRAAKKILVRVLCLTSSFTCPGIDSWGLYPSLLMFFVILPWAKGVCPSCLSYGLCPKDRLGFFVNSVQFLYLLL